MSCKHDFHWYPEAANETGWRCCLCQHKPGEPAGFSPELDASETERKVYGVLMDLHAHDLVYVSNGSHGDYLTVDVAGECLRRGIYDQKSILAMLATRLASDVVFWKEIGDGVRAGKDPRPRCPCGRLSTSSSCTGNGPWIRRCKDHDESDFDSLPELGAEVDRG